MNGNDDYNITMNKACHCQCALKQEYWVSATAADDEHDDDDGDDDDDNEDDDEDEQFLLQGRQ